MALIDLVIEHFDVDRIQASQFIQMCYKNKNISELKFLVNFRD